MPFSVNQSSQLSDMRLPPGVSTVSQYRLGKKTQFLKCQLTLFVKSLNSCYFILHLFFFFLTIIWTWPGQNISCGCCQNQCTSEGETLSFVIVDIPLKKRTTLQYLNISLINEWINKWLYLFIFIWQLQCCHTAYCQEEAVSRLLVRIIKPKKKKWRQYRETMTL